MGVRMMKWRPRPPLSSKKFEAKILVRCLQGLPAKATSGVISDGGEGGDPRDFSRFGVEVKWKGSFKSNNRLNFKRSSAKRNLTREESLNDDGAIEWNEEFVAICDLLEFTDGRFQQWEVAFRVFDGLNHGAKRRDQTIATGSLNIAEFASSKQEKTPININLSVPTSVECSPILAVSLCLHEYAIPLPLSPSNRDVKSGFKKAKIFRVLSPNRDKKSSSEEEGNSQFDTDSLDGSDSELDHVDSNVEKSFNYGTLAHANQIGEFSQFHSSGSEDDDYTFKHYKSNEDDLHSERRFSMREIFRKRKIGFRSPKRKGEPLLKKDVREEGGDDIDFDRRMLISSSDKEGSTTSRSSTSEFGDDNFTIGKWVNKELTSRDGQMKVKTQVFFASIDQRSSRASGESACTVLVATIADWFQNNNHEMPVKSELDTLILEGSSEWRNLCENESYMKQFPNKHFDLETVLESKSRNLVVVPEKSFIGFFQLDEGVFDFLHGAMSFDNIWDEIDRIESEKPLVYIVSWNDHFFVLRVDRDAYYIIDTLGERLYEGCDQAYVLKFDKDTTIKKDEVTVCEGKKSCKEYIKSFLAAIPLRELKTDVEKGLVDVSSPLVHHRLQIEFHYSEATLGQLLY